MWWFIPLLSFGLALFWLGLCLLVMRTRWWKDG
jgi:hypothetical protein